MEREPFLLGVGGAFAVAWISPPRTLLKNLIPLATISLLVSLLVLMTYAFLPSVLPLALLLPSPGKCLLHHKWKDSVAGSLPGDS